MDDLSVTVSRRLTAPPRVVFDAWLDPTRAWRWMGRITGEVVRAEVDARVGGAIRYVIRRDGREIEHVGELTEIERPRRIAYSWAVPAFSETVSLVTLDFEPVDGGAEVRLTQTRLQPELAKHRAAVEAGWGAILEAVGAELGER